MPALRTELTEIVTGLGMLGIERLDDALTARPPEMLNVATRHFDRLVRARESGEYASLFGGAWDNGRAFASSVDGLRHRRPLRVEWKGSHQPPGYEQAPADLRVDYVYLISCKYRSKILYNASPAHLFDRLLSRRRGRRIDWFLEAAPDEYQHLYSACRNYLAADDLPRSVTELGKADRAQLKEGLRGRWVPGLAGPYRRFCRAISRASAARWQKALGTDSRVREEMLWRLLRLQPAPYFILGVDPKKRPMRLRVDTPWDFRRHYTLESLGIEPDPEAGQPTVRWHGALTDKGTALPIHVKGHVEVRWSHGRFRGAPEAKIYLDTPHEQTPGYQPLR